MIIFLTSYILRNVFIRLEDSGRLAHIYIKLEEYDIKFQPYTTIKV